jgi:2-polyprenyl-6-methoxyphenol hydroxylase-like FAD-dependent oxidoreductase
MAGRHAEIVGAGFAGLCAAAALGRRGWSVRVHEQASEVRAFGAGIWFWENGLRVLNLIGACDEALDGAIEAKLWESIAVDGRQIERVDFGPGGGPRLFCIVRHHLLSCTRRAAERAGAEIVTGSTGISVTPEGELLLENGNRLMADLIVAADGVYSIIRDSLGLVRSRRKHLDGIIRVLVPRIADELEAPDARHIVECWSGPHRLLLTPVSQDILYLALASQDFDKIGTRIPVDKGSWVRWFPHLEAIIRRIGDEGRYDAFETIFLKRWSVGKVAIIGDAAHSMSAGLGQGAGTAMMNGLGLAVALDETPDMDAAMARWERRERPLTEHTQR